LKGRIVTSLLAIGAALLMLMQGGCISAGLLADEIVWRRQQGVINEEAHERLLANPALTDALKEAAWSSVVANAHCRLVNTTDYCSSIPSPRGNPEEVWAAGREQSRAYWVVEAFMKLCNRYYPINSVSDCDRALRFEEKLDSDLYDSRNMRDPRIAAWAASAARP
jgi:hypothetical protein